MAETLSLMEFLQALLTDPDLRDSFGQDPDATLVAHGLADLSPADVHDALVLVQDNQTVDFTLDPAGMPAPPPPPPLADGHEAAVDYLARYVADPQQTGGPDRSAPGQEWADLDPEAAVAPPAAPYGGSPVGGDSAFGAGHDTADHDTAGHDTADGDRWDDLLADGGSDPFGFDAPDPAASAAGPTGSYDVLDDLDDLGDFDLGDGPHPTPDAGPGADHDPDHRIPDPGPDGL